MKKALIAIASVSALVLTTITQPSASGVGAPEPPYEGTIFLDPDIVTESDPSALASVTYAGRGMRQVYDRRVEAFVDINAYLFNTSYDDGLRTEAVVNPEFGSRDIAREQAETYARLVGQLPHVLREDVDQLWIHRGTQPFGGGSRSILIHTGQSAHYLADGILEETLVHEAAHTSLDAGYYRAGSGWRQAQNADNAFISTYARDFPLREDVAETFLLYQAVRYSPDRIDEELAETVRATVPHRLQFLDGEQLNMYPVAPAPDPPSSSTLVTASEPGRDGWLRESARGSARAGRATAKGKQIRVGDDRVGRETRGLLSFNVSALPESASVTGVDLRIVVAKQRGRAPRFLKIDLRAGSFGTPGLRRRDFAAPATRSFRVRFSPGRGPLLIAVPASADVFKPGARVQLRIRALPVRARNKRADAVLLTSGESARSGPELRLHYFPN